MAFLVPLSVILIGLLCTFRPGQTTLIMLQGGKGLSEAYVRQFALSLRLIGPLWVIFGLYILIDMAAI